MKLLSEATWAEVERLREIVGARNSPTLEDAAQRFVAAIADAFTSVALARLFVVLPYEQVPARERDFAKRIVAGDPRLGPNTRVLALLGTRGNQAKWNDRNSSRGHLCIPLIDKTFIEAAPMVAKLLADIDVDLAAFDDGRPIATRRLLGGNNGMFYVADAATATDGKGRYVIADRDFVQQHHIRTVFGMAGAYADGTLVIGIVFSTEKLDRLVVDRFPTLIVNFKIATAALVDKRSVFNAPGV